MVNTITRNRELKHEREIHISFWWWWSYYRVTIKFARMKQIVVLIYGRKSNPFLEWNKLTGIKKNTPIQFNKHIN